jgi:transcriptional regulator with XRE-family HTH domain
LKKVLFFFIKTDRYFIYTRIHYIYYREVVDMYDSDFTSRFREVLRIRDMTQADVARLTGFSTTKVSYYYTGRNEPNKGAMLDLARVLGVDVGWLMGLDVPMTPSKTAPTMGAGESGLVNIYRALNDFGKERLLERAEEMLGMPKYTSPAAAVGDAGDIRQLSA